MTAAHDPATPQPESAPQPAGAAAADDAIQISARPTAPAVAITSSGQPPTPANSPTGADPLTTELFRVDQIMVLLTLAFAFLLASFPATNTDLWMNLAAGRLIAHGQFPFSGPDPFSYAADSTWINTSWLSQLIGYGVAQLFGGPESAAGGAALVVLKALLVVALTAVLLLIHRPRQSLWVPAVMVSLALLVLSPRLLLQPVCVSYLFLGLTLYLLQRPVPDSAERQSGWRGWWFSTRRRWALPVLFALWANLDSWFLLGPVTLALFLLGEVVESYLVPVHSSRHEREPEELQQLGLILAVGLAACVLNPFHVRVFALPPELETYWHAGSFDESYFSWIVLSPLDARYLNSSAWYNNLAAYALPLLLVVTVGSFVWNVKGWRGWRVCVCLPFLFLGATWARATPFLAVVAAPIAVLNFADGLALRRRTGPLTKAQVQWSLAGRLATLTGLSTLLVLAWPGWLNPNSGSARYSRHVGWSVPIDPSLSQAAMALRQLYDSQVLQPESHGFNLNLDSAHYCTWFCPREKGFLDYRLHRYSEGAVKDYVQSRQALERRTRGRPQTRAGGYALQINNSWQPIFRARQIDHIVVHGNQWNDIATLLFSLWFDPKQQWTMLYADGQTCIFGWNLSENGELAEKFARRSIDPVAEAFGPGTGDAPAAQLSVPPSESGDALPGAESAQRPAPDWWASYTQRPAPRPPALDRAQMWLNYTILPLQQHNDAERLVDHLLRRGHMNGASAAALGQSGGGASAGALLLANGYRYPGPSLLPLLPPSPRAEAMALLAVRDTRRALDARSDEGEAYYVLGRAIQNLETRQSDALNRDKAAATRFLTLPIRFNARRRLDQIRGVQAATAFVQTLQLMPDGPHAADAHEALAQIFSRYPTHLDLTLTHAYQALRLRFEAGPRPREPESDFQERIRVQKQQFRRTVNEFAQYRRRLGQLTGDFSLQNAELDSPDKLLQELTKRYDLASNLPSEMEKANIALKFGLANTAIKVMTENPNIRDVSPQEKQQVFQLLLVSGRVEYLRGVESAEDDNDIVVLLNAALGNYAAVDERLELMVNRLDRERSQAGWQSLHLQFSPLASQPGVLRQMVLAPSLLLGESADLRTLRGLLALERGDTIQAEAQFRSALRTIFPGRAMCVPLTGLASGSPLEMLGFQAAEQGHRDEARFYFIMAPLARNYLRIIEETTPVRNSP